MPLLLDTAEALCKVSSRGLCARREDGSARRWGGLSSGGWV